MRTYYDTLLQTIPGRDIRPPRRILPHLPFYSELLEAAEQYDQALKAGQHEDARQIKILAAARVARWIEDQAARISAEVAEQEQVTAARAAINLTIDPLYGF
jgi:hypothetical protein